MVGSQGPVVAIQLWGEEKLDYKLPMISFNDITKCHQDVMNACLLKTVS